MNIALIQLFNIIGPFKKAVIFSESTAARQLQKLRPSERHKVPMGPTAGMWVIKCQDYLAKSKAIRHASAT
jgi:hypothetical protein